MIEMVDASVAELTVSRRAFDIASTDIAVEAVLNVLPHFPTVTVPVVDHKGVYRIHFGAVEAGDDQGKEVSHDNCDHSNSGGF